MATDRGEQIEDLFPLECRSRDGPLEIEGRDRLAEGRDVLGMLREVGVIRALGQQLAH